MKRFEYRVSLATVAVSIVTLVMLWTYLADTTFYHRPGIGKGPYNQHTPNKADQW